MKIQIDDVVRDATALELAQFETDRINNEQRDNAARAAESAKVKATTAAIAHAKTLGFTELMIGVMYPNLVTGSALTPDDYTTQPEPVIEAP